MANINWLPKQEKIRSFEMKSREFGDRSENKKNNNKKKNEKSLNLSEEIAEDYLYDLEIVKNFLNRTRTT